MRLLKIFKSGDKGVMVHFSEQKTCKARRQIPYFELGQLLYISDFLLPCGIYHYIWKIVELSENEIWVEEI